MQLQWLHLNQRQEKELAMNNQLNEGLRPLDLKNLISPTFEVDTYKSKMGEDRDVCVISFHAKDRSPAKDLMEFIEKGYNFVLDSDVGSGENDKGEYHVFVELDRGPKLAEQIKDIIDGVERLTGIDQWQFRYHKDATANTMTTESLKSKIPDSPVLYDNKLTQIKVESLKSFFNRTLMDDISLENSVITIHKPFNQKIKMKWLAEDDPQAIVENAPSVDEKSTAEVFWLTKVVGDYDIQKFGDRFLFTNGPRAIFLQRIE